MNVRQAVSAMCSQGWSIFAEVDGFIEDYGNAIGWYDIVQPLKSPDNSEKDCIASKLQIYLYSLFF